MVKIGSEKHERKLDIRCAECEADDLLANGISCANCGGFIFPDSQVGVISNQGEDLQVCHTTYECSPAGGTFYGYWGRGKLVSSHTTVEQC